MFKRILSTLLLLTLTLSVLCSCGSADIMDDFVNDLAEDYSNNYKPGIPGLDIDDTLQLILDNYVSGLSIPDKDDIDFSRTDPSDQDTSNTANTDDTPDTDTPDTDAPDDDHSGNPSPSVAHCLSVDDMKQFLLKAIADTESSATFTIDNSNFDFDILYDVIFKQIYEEYVIESMGMQTYKGNYTEYTPGIYTVTVEFVYFDNEYSLDVVKDMKADALSRAKEIIRELDLANKSEYEIVYEVNKYLCDNCVYPDQEPYSNESHTIYGALIEKSAVCEGYAKTAHLIFTLCGMDCYYVVGDTPTGGHGWNLVSVEDKFYQLDITWNDSEYQPNGYFLVTDQFMSKSRTWDYSRYPASSTKPYK